MSDFIRLIYQYDFELGIIIVGNIDIVIAFLLSSHVIYAFSMVDPVVLLYTAMVIVIIMAATINTCHYILVLPRCTTKLTVLL